MRPTTNASYRTGMLLAAFTYIGCAGGQASVVVDPPVAPLTAVAVTPVDLRAESPAIEPSLRTADILALLWDQSDWAVLGPHRIQTLRTPVREPLKDTNLVFVAQKLQLDPHHLGLLTSRVTLQEAKGQTQVAGATGSSYEGTWIVTLTLRDSRGATIAEAQARATRDPFAEHPDYDARPELRAAIMAATAQLIEACERCVRPSPHPNWPVHVTPAALGSLGGLSVAKYLRALGPLERDTALLNIAQYLNPEFTLRDAQRLGKLPSGFCWTESTDAFGQGECATAINGAAPSSPHDLRWAPRPRTLKVTGPSGGARTVELLE